MPHPVFLLCRHTLLKRAEVLFQLRRTSVRQLRISFVLPVSVVKRMAMRTPYGYGIRNIFEEIHLESLSRAEFRCIGTIS